MLCTEEWKATGTTNRILMNWQNTKRKMIRNKAWEEAKDNYVNAICARRYANTQRRLQFLYEVFIPILSALCTFCASIKWQKTTICSAAIILISSLFKALAKNIILPEKDIETLDNLGIEFDDYRNKSESIFNHIDDETLTDLEAQEELDKLQKKSSKANSVLDKLVIGIPFWIDKKMGKERDDYFKKTYHNDYG